MSISEFIERLNFIADGDHFDLSSDIKDVMPLYTGGLFFECNEVISDE